MKVIYLAHPITAKRENGEADELAIARLCIAADILGRKISDAGFAVIIPGNNTRDWYHHYGFNYDFFLPRAFATILKCDAVFLAPLWTQSYGCRQERHFAFSNHIPVFEDLDTMVRELKENA